MVRDTPLPTATRPPAANGKRSFWQWLFAGRCPRQTEPNPLAQQLGDSLREAFQALEYALQDITALEINTLVVARISGDKFVPEEAYRWLMAELARLTDAMNLHTAKGLQEVHDRLVQRSRDLKQRSQAVSPDHWLQVECLKRDLEEYNADLARFQAAAREREIAREAGDTTAEDEPLPHAREDYQQLRGTCDRLRQQLRDLAIDTDGAGTPVMNPRQTRQLRKIWELWAAEVNGDRIYAQTTIQLDGDVIERFDRQLFDTSAFPPNTARLLVELHRQGVQVAQAQWQRPLELLVGLWQRLQ